MLFCTPYKSYTINFQQHKSRVRMTLIKKERKEKEKREKSEKREKEGKKEI